MSADLETSSQVKVRQSNDLGRDPAMAHEAWRGGVQPPSVRDQPTEMPNALSPINTTVVETRLQQPAAAKATASANTYRFTDKTRTPSYPHQSLAGHGAARHNILN